MDTSRTFFPDDCLRPGFINRNNKYLDIKQPFSPQEEERLLLDAIQEPNDEKKWTTFFNYINVALSGLVPHGSLQQDNERNIRNIVRIIREQRWNENSWQKQNIYSQAFFDICKIPICLPATFLGLLSGEYIIYLLHPNEIEFYYNEVVKIDKNEFKCSSSNEHESDYIDIEEYEREKEKKIYQKKYQRYYSSRNPYTKQFEETLGISFQIIGNLNEYNSQKKQRKNTALWHVFELNSYLTEAYPESKIENDDRIFTSLDKPFIDLFNEGLLDALSDAQKKLLLFLTIQYQEMNSEDKSAVSRHQHLMRIYSMTAKQISYEFKQWMFGLFIQAYDPAYLSVQDAARKAYHRAYEQWSKKIDILQEKAKQLLDDNYRHQKFREKIIISEENIHSILMWRILSLLRQREVEINRTTINLPIQSIREYRENSIPLNQRLSTAKQIQARDENDFLQRYSKIMEIEFPGKSSHDLSKMLMIAVNVIVFCNHDRFGFDYLHNKTKRAPKWKWYAKVHVNLNELQLNEIIACMKLLDLAKEIYVETFGKGTKRYLRTIIDKPPKKTSKTLYEIMKNINTHASEPLFKSLIGWYSAQNDGNLILSDMLHLQNKIEILYHTVIRGASYASKTIIEEQSICSDIIHQLSETMINFQSAFIYHSTPSIL